MTQVLRCDRCGMEIQKASCRVQVSHLPIMRTPGRAVGGDVCRRCGEAMLATWFAPPTQPPLPEEEHFEGFADRDCGEHRTVGYRAWCHECTAWCYPHSPCRGCELPKLKKGFQQLAKEFRRLAAEAEEHEVTDPPYYIGVSWAFRQAAQMLEEKLNG